MFRRPTTTETTEAYENLEDLLGIGRVPRPTDQPHHTRNEDDFISDVPSADRKQGEPWSLIRCAILTAFFVVGVLVRAECLLRWM